MSHLPVMLDQAVAALELAPGKRIVDCTFGAGGYSAAILQVPGVELLGLDRDPMVQACAQEMQTANAGRFSFYQTKFSGLQTALQAKGWDQVDGIVLDVGVSSMQIDQSHRGFSFLRDGPLDMRMSQSGVSAADVVNQLSAMELKRIFRVYGEEKRARAAAEAIVLHREQQAFVTTGELAGLLEQVLGPKKGRIHPATKVFQALRIFVNDELGELDRLLRVAEQVLRPAGRLVVVAFHSLEDRLVKNFFRLRAEAPALGSRHAPMAKPSTFQPSFELVQRKVIVPTPEEIRANPRARSARLRWAVRTDQAAMLAVPALVSVVDLAMVEETT